MEIPVINRIRDFEVGINSINDQSIFYQISTVSGVGKSHQVYSFWKWGALIIAFLASFTPLIKTIKLLILRLRKIDSSSTTLTTIDGFISETEVSCSSSYEEVNENDDDDDKEEEETTSDWRLVNDDFSVRGSGYYLDDGLGQNRNFTIRHRRNGSLGDSFSLSDLAGSSVVKTWDLCGHQNVVASFLEKRRVLSSSRSVILMAGKTGYEGVKVGVWDAGAGFRVPALLAERRRPRILLGKIIGVDAGGGGKIYGRDDFSRGTNVWYMKKVSGALTDLKESDLVKWCDADAVN